MGRRERETGSVKARETVDVRAQHLPWIIFDKAPPTRRVPAGVTRSL